MESTELDDVLLSAGERAAILGQIRCGKTPLEACDAVNVPHEAYFATRMADRAFSASIASCHSTKVDKLEDVALMQALCGNTAQVQFLLKAYKPETYNPVERKQIQQNVRVDVSISDMLLANKHEAAALIVDAEPLKRIVDDTISD